MVAAARAARTLLLADESFRDVPFPGTAPAAAADGRVRRRDPGAVARLGVEVVLGRAAGGLDPGRAGAGAATGRRPGAGRHGRPGAGSVGGRRTCSPTPGRRWSCNDPGWPPAPPRCSRRWPRTCRTGSRRTPQGGTSLWVRLPGPFATDLALLAPPAGRADRTRAAVRAGRHHGVLPAAAVHHRRRAAGHRGRPAGRRSPGRRRRARGRRCRAGWPDGYHYGGARAPFPHTHRLPAQPIARPSSLAKGLR